MEFKPGDVVALKSGGHEMTVEDTRDGKVVCVWSDSGKRIKQQSFSPHLLKYGGEWRALQLNINISDDPTSPDSSF